MCAIGINNCQSGHTVLYPRLLAPARRLPTLIASQTGPAHGVDMLPDRIAGAEVIVNRLAYHVKSIDLGHVGMRRLRKEEARHDESTGEVGGHGAGPATTDSGPVPLSRIRGTRYLDCQCQPALRANALRCRRAKVQRRVN